MADPVGVVVEQLRVDSMDVRTNLVFPQEKNIYFPLPTISSSLRVYRNPVSAFRVFVSGNQVIYYGNYLGSQILARLLLIILIYLNYDKDCNYELGSLMYVYFF